MTGYIWLCETCDGTGGRMHFFGRDSKPVPMKAGKPGECLFIIMYKGIGPTWIWCDECNGKGYWEP